MVGLDLLQHIDGRPPRRITRPIIAPITSRVRRIRDGFVRVTTARIVRTRCQTPSHIQRIGVRIGNVHNRQIILVLLRNLTFRCGRRSCARLVNVHSPVERAVHVHEAAALRLEQNAAYRVGHEQRPLIDDVQHRVQIRVDDARTDVRRCDLEAVAHANCHAADRLLGGAVAAHRQDRRRRGAAQLTDGRLTMWWGDGIRSECRCELWERIMCENTSAK